MKQIYTDFFQYIPIYYIFSIVFVFHWTVLYGLNEVPTQAESNCSQLSSLKKSVS